MPIVGRVERAPRRAPRGSFFCELLHTYMRKSLILCSLIFVAFMIDVFFHHAFFLVLVTLNTTIETLIETLVWDTLT